eukprot:gnl/TRDRNA2_/TRDRNA2_133990_c0_seq1.p1 gnl/TRDRNA2_/TRDRNA2_133990_c0~~gnl/TRDRNA2_/TRDRNA2_133990_c0_seq1.p1  ORF type:complete len:572 (+),score=101.91 gnl/TRDRNA2_/TRDRNA2_133990_c0_seq1:33-1748(+)
MNWVYNRAASAMLITSATTCAAFVCTVFTPLTNIQSFGLFSAFVIAADYVLVITWFPACVVLYHNFMESRPCCCSCWRCNKMWPCSSMETTTATVYQKGIDASPEDKRFLERMLSGPFMAMIKKGAPFIVGIFLLLLIPFGILAGNIQTLSRSEESLPSDHPFQRLWTIYGEKFPGASSYPNTEVHVVWGVDGINHDGVSLIWDPESRGKLVMDSKFKFDESCQQHIFNMCESVRTMEGDLDKFLSRNTDVPGNPGWVECPMWDWKDWLERNGKPFPLPLSQVSTEMVKFLQLPVASPWGGDNSTMGKRWKNELGFNPKDGEVQIVMINVRSVLAQRSAHPRDRLLENYELFEDWVASVNKQAGPTSNNAFQTSEGDFNGPNWVWAHTQGIFISSAISGSTIGCIIAFIVILAATRQIIIAVAAFLTIGSILLSVIAMMKLAGYELGTITSICITILAGFAVDYVVHLAHAYEESSKPTRQEKTQEAMDVIGVSVLSGMVTSVLAAIALLLCSLQFFAKFGFFLIFTVVWSWIWGNAFFMSLMYLVGPDESVPWYLQMPKSVCKLRKKAEA